jgi:hypothetical protein
MPGRKTPEALARVGRSPGRDSAGRVIGAERGNAMCSHAARKLAQAKAILDDETYQIYIEAVTRIDAEIPHTSEGYHGIPDDDSVADIGVVERAVNTIVPPELELRSSHLYDLISRNAERSAD